MKKWLTKTAEDFVAGTALTAFGLGVLSFVIGGVFCGVVIVQGQGAPLAYVWCGALVVCVIIAIGRSTRS